MMKIEESLNIINETLDSLIKGQVLKMPLKEEDFPAQLAGTIERVNRLNHEIAEINGFLLHMTRGNLEVDPPSRTNYLSSPAKEIHSQLTSLSISMEMLVEGKMVGKLYYPGRLYDLYNTLIDKVSEVLSRNAVHDENGDLWNTGPTSWRSHQILRAINQLNIIILEVDSSGEIVFANPPAKEAFKGIVKLPYGNEDKVKDALMSYLCVFGNNNDETEYPVLYEMHDYSRSVWYKIRSDRVKIAGGKEGILHVIDDISEWKDNEMQLRQKSMIDPLTGAYSRFAGLQKLDEMMRTRHIHKNCAAFVDLDRLKYINDKFGHMEGDRALKMATDILRKTVRESDWVVRYGGDEFLVYFMDCTYEMTERVVARMYKELDDLNANSDRPYELSFSIGFAELTKDVKNIESFISLIDEKMYADKRKKRHNT